MLPVPFSFFKESNDIEGRRRIWKLIRRTFGSLMQLYGVIDPDNREIHTYMKVL